MNNSTKSAKIARRNAVLRKFCKAMLVKRSIDAQVEYETTEYAKRS